MEKTTDGGTVSTLRVPLDSALRGAARDVDEGVVVTAVGPTGVERSGPLVTATVDGRTAFFTDPDRETVRGLAESLADEELPTDGADGVVGHDIGVGTLPTPDGGPLSVGTRRVLGPCGWVAPDDLDALGGPTRGDPRQEVREAGLLGRGRGDGAPDRPVVDEWDRANDADGDSVVVVNANEADYRAEGDRLLLESAPLTVLDGALLVARAVEATDVVVYLNEDDATARQRVEDAIAALGEHDGRDDVVPEVVAGPDQYTAGEMTMALEAMEGADRIEARLRPPYPSEHGLYGRPTVIHTPRTLAQVRSLVRDAEAFGSRSESDDPGTRLVSVAGDVAHRVTVELPTGASLSRAREAMDVEGRFKMACVGGQFGGLTRSLDVPASAPALAAADLGTNGVVELFDTGQCAVETAGSRARFARDENCGRCVPCREGSKQLLDLLRDVYDGSYEADMLRELTRTMATTSTCAFGSEATRPVTTAMDDFETEFRAHAEGRCPSGACDI
ncbi:NADH-ubiquinone oxidoreductase-F iron-sulfur binding region domain-containing protein [Halomarina oriensis]|uniref:NADH dehydrogenase FAD-containing subunit n=1 Tax=Halomarina oriensis TaxID=671145 RepID=A0A6B0GRN4_9EURY|nr:NADH-ubiquinone oxidoreductase-F iron-sulfur binding region domain-containing protein [Halomarina oriensis]MWG35353.1 NADH dehydrogenase FAD-containing subunit [Halomarina oriensis]